MDTPPFEHLGRFLERIKNIGFFERLFSWKTTVSLGYDAYGDYQQIQSTLRKKDQDIIDLTARIRDLSKDLELQKQTLGQAQNDLIKEQNRAQSLIDKVGEKESARAKLEATLSETITNTDETILRLKEDLVNLKSKNEELVHKIGEMENEAGGLKESDKKNTEYIQNLNENISSLTTKIELLNTQYTEAKETIAKLRENEEERVRLYESRVTELNALKKQLDEDRLRVQAERDAEIRKKFEEMEQTWKKHEEVVEQSLRSICQRHTLEYCDKEKFPIAGEKTGQCNPDLRPVRNF